LLAIVSCQRDRKTSVRENASPVTPPVTLTTPIVLASTTVTATEKPSTLLAKANNAPQDPTTKPKWDDASFKERALPLGLRLYAKTRHIWIYAEPDSTTQWIGYLWTGGSVELRDEKLRYGQGCGAYYAIKPRGYICADNGRVTLDPKDPVVLATFPYSPRIGSPFLHRYGESRGAPLYLSLPTEEEQSYRERDLTAHRERVKNAREGKPRHSLLEDVDLSPAPIGNFEFPKLSPSVYEAHRELKPRSTVAYSAEVRFLERDFLLTSDYRFIPKDRVVPYENRYFKGLVLTDSVRLPIAWFRDPNRSKYQRTSEGQFEATRDVFPLHSYVALSGKEATVDKTTYLETQTGEWVRRADASVPQIAKKTPWDAEVGKPDDSPLRPKGRGTWIEVSISEGWLLAYEGTRPVFTTLISPGRGGASVAHRDPLETAATPVGRFSITGKFISSTMVAPHDYIHSEVPYAQNFSGPYALHSAYWHNNWGHWMSGGCINLSPIDALYLFQWTEPLAPPDWYGTRWLPYLEPSTTLIIRR
jgi:hypothetical protein